MLPFLAMPVCYSAAQQVDYNRIIPAASVANEDFAEKLVRLSWQNLPSNIATQSQIIIAENAVTMARWSWLDRLTFSSNLNEYTIGARDLPDGRTAFWPKYNFNISFSPGMILKVPMEIKTAKENLRLTQLATDEQKIQTRNLVLQRYQDYLMQKQVLEMEARMLESATTEFELKEERFKRGQLLLDEYNESARAYMSQQRQKLAAETNYIKAKLELESLIGVRLEDVK